MILTLKTNTMPLPTRVQEIESVPGWFETLGCGIKSG